MTSKHHRRLKQASGLIALLALQSQTNGLAQISPKSDGTIAQTAQNTNQKPFDKLELFCFFAAGPVATYAKHILQERGADFTPDTDFISSFSSEVQRDILRGVHPKNSHNAEPDRDQAYELAGKAYQDQQRHLYPTASSEYQAALQLAPDSATLHLAYAGESLFARDFARADDEARTSIKLWPENCEAHAMLALSMVLQKRSGEAERESKEALKLFPKHTSAKFTLAQSLTNEHKYKEAIPAIREAIAVVPSMSALGKFLGIALMETGDTAGGIEQLAAYTKLAPDDAEGHYYFGVALRVKGEREQAHAQFVEAVRLKPNDPQYHVAANPDTELSEEPTGGPKPEDASTTANEYSNRFFGFIYPIPNNWNVLNPLSAHAAVENLRAQLTANDPTAEDFKKVEAKLVHTLLYATSDKSGKPLDSMKLVTITAVDARFEEHATASSYADAVTLRILKTGLPGETRGAPVQVSIGGRAFWKTEFVMRPATHVRYGTEFVTSTKGYFLTFTFGAPDLGTLGEIEKSLNSMQFQTREK